MEKVNILGTEYSVDRNARKDNLPEGCDGCCEFYKKQIRVEKTDSQDYEKFVLRHEIVHAFFSESGISFDEDTEEMICDWLAIQGEKIMKAWKSVGAV